MHRYLDLIPPRSVAKDLAGHFQKVQVPRGQLGAVDTPDTTMCGGNKKEPRENMKIHGGKRSKYRGSVDQSNGFKPICFVSF